MTTARSIAARLYRHRLVRVGWAVGTFFLLKIALGFALISLSAHRLAPVDFVAFSQLFLFFALLSTLAAAGVQNGLIRQVAVAAGDPIAETRAVAAAFVIAAVFGVVLLALVVLLRAPLSRLLVNDTSLAGIVPWLTLAALGSGVGVLFCAVLTGRGRGATSLMLQAAGLIAGGAVCIWRLREADASGAVLGYALGPLATTLLAMLWVRGGGWTLGRARPTIGAEARLLLGYALSFLAVAVIMPATLFALRYVYRDVFGPILLGYWLAANRVSDVTSQLLGIYMGQIFLPSAAREASPDRTRRLLATTFGLGTAVMLAGWAVFLLGAPWFVRTFFSVEFLPAIPFISGYLLGDSLRVAASMAMHLMLARRRVAAAVAIEGTTALLFATYVALLTLLGRAEAPYWAYPAAYATMAMGLGAFYLRRGRALARVGFTNPPGVGRAAEPPSG